MHSATIKIDGAWNEVPEGREGKGQLFGRWATLPKEFSIKVALKSLPAGYISVVRVLTLCLYSLVYLSLADEAAALLKKSDEPQLCGGDKENKELVKHVTASQAEQTKQQLKISKWQGTWQLD